MNRRSFFRRATQVAGTAAIAPSLIKEALANIPIATPLPIEVPKTPLLTESPKTEVAELYLSMSYATASSMWPIWLERPPYYRKPE